MTPREGAEKFVAAVNSGDADRLAALMTPKHRFVDADGAGLEGRERVQAAWVEFFAHVPDYRIEVAEILERGDDVVLFGTASGTIREKGRLRPENGWSVPAAWRATIEGDLVSLWRLYADLSVPRTIVKRVGGGG